MQNYKLFRNRIHTRLALSLHTYTFEKRIMQNIYHPRNNTHLLRVFILFLIAFILFLRSMKFSYLCKVINNVPPAAGISGLQSHFQKTGTQKTHSSVLSETLASIVIILTKVGKRIYGWTKKDTADAVRLTTCVQYWTTQKDAGTRCATYTTFGRLCVSLSRQYRNPEKKNFGQAHRSYN